MEQYQEAAALYLEKARMEELCIPRIRSKSITSQAVTDSSSDSNSTLEMYRREFQEYKPYSYENFPQSGSVDSPTYYPDLPEAPEMSPTYSMESSRPPVPNTGERQVYQVQFKHNFRDYTTQPGHFLPIYIGTFVEVKSDFGVDMGVVTHIQPMSVYLKTYSQRKYLNPETEDDSLGLILRIASLEQRKMLPAKLKRETKVMKNVLRLVHEVHHLQMKIIGVEYQADLLKLTIHYVAEIHIDFRALVKELFALYRVRIWMKKCNPNVTFTPKKFAVLSLATGTSHEDNWEKHVY